MAIDGIVVRGRRPLNRRLSLALFPKAAVTTPRLRPLSSDEAAQIDRDVDRSFSRRAHAEALRSSLRQVVVGGLDDSLHYYQVRDA